MAPVPISAPTTTVAFAQYGGAIATAIRRLKYDDRPDIARVLGDLLGDVCRPLSIPAAIVVPVPLHPVRLAERGYNQAALLATRVARSLHLPILARALRRVANTPPQAQLTRVERLSNVAQAFGVPCPRWVRDRAIVLVDDVSTTGATLAACSEALRKAGASSVSRVVVASTPPT